MQVKITKNGEEIVLLKTEREALRKALVLLASIGRHTVGPVAEKLTEASGTIETFLAGDGA